MGFLERFGGPLFLLAGRLLPPLAPLAERAEETAREWSRVSDEEVMEKVIEGWGRGGRRWAGWSEGGEEGMS